MKNLKRNIVNFVMDPLGEGFIVMGSMLMFALFIL